MTKNDKAKKDKATESFIRWQGIALTQLSYSINLILTFTLATIGFAVSLLFNDDFQPVSWACVYFLSLLLLLASGGSGVWCTINRLKDFRATEKITRLEHRNVDDNDNDNELTELRRYTKKLGNRTWGIFWWQIGTFSVGFLLLALSVVFTV